MESIRYEPDILDKKSEAVQTLLKKPVLFHLPIKSIANGINDASASTDMCQTVLLEQVQPGCGGHSVHNAGVPGDGDAVPQDSQRNHIRECEDEEN